MNSVSVDIRLEMREAIDLALMRPPVVLVAPVLDQLLQIGEIRSILPASIGHFIGKASVLEARLQVGERGVGHLDFESFDIGHGHYSGLTRVSSYSSPAPVAARVLPSRLNASIT